jgi:microcystin-dependent protein
MANPFVGEIRLFAGNFAPVGWFFCQGQTLPISQYDVLYTLIGTTYGGDGVQTFNLPNLASRVPVQQGTLAGGGVYVLGQTGGVEQVVLNANQIGPHSHTALCSTAAGTSGAPAGDVLAGSATPLYANTGAGGAMSSGSVTSAGGGQPHENRPPFLALNFIIAYEGIYPSQG